MALPNRQPSYFPEISKREHDDLPLPETKRVSLWGWNADTTSKIKVAVDEDGNLVTSSVDVDELEGLLGKTLWNEESQIIVAPTATSLLAQLGGLTSTQAIDLEKDDNQYVEIGNKAALNLTSGSWTVEAEIKLESVANYLQIVSKWNNAGISWSLNLGTSSKPNIIFRTGATYKTVQSDTAVGIGNWYHIAGVFDDTADTLKLFLGGILVGTLSSVTGNPNSNAAKVMIGARDTAGSPELWFDGLIQNVRISNSVRYTSNFTPSTALFTDDVNTLGLWWLNGDLTDSSGSSNDGTFQGSGSESYATGILSQIAATIPSADYRFKHVWGTGNTDGVFTLKKNGSRVWTARNAWTQRTISDNMELDLDPSIDTLELFVENRNTVTSGLFEGGFYGYEL